MLLVEIFNRETKDKYKSFQINKSNCIGIYENEVFEVGILNSNSDSVKLSVSIDGQNIYQNENEFWNIKSYGGAHIFSWLGEDIRGKELMFKDKGFIEIYVLRESVDPKLITINYMFWPEVRKILASKSDRYKINRKCYNRFK